MEKRILAHVEEVEFVKEVARQQVNRIVEDTDPIDVLDEPDQLIDSILAAVLGSLEFHTAKLKAEAADYAEALGLARLSESEIDAIEDEAQDDFVIAARAALVAALVPVEAQIRAMIDRAESEADSLAMDTVATSLSTQATKAALLAGFISAARNATATYVQELDRAIVARSTEALVERALEVGVDVNGAGALIDEDGNEVQEPNFEWVAVMDGNSCDDVIENSCAPRHGTLFKLEEWAELGEPGAPNLLCSIYSRTGSYCRCVLAESGRSGSSRSINPIQVTEAIAAAKERAQNLFAA